VQHILLHNNSNSQTNRRSNNHLINPNNSKHVLMAQTLIGLVNDQNNSNRTDRFHVERMQPNKNKCYNPLNRHTKEKRVVLAGALNVTGTSTTNATLTCNVQIKINKAVYQTDGIKISDPHADDGIRIRQDKLFKMDSRDAICLWIIDVSTRLWIAQLLTIP
jgi:hypothetical protein